MMISIKNLQKRFGKVEALREVSLDWNCGETIALIGPNGSGKTTLIKCMLGLVVPDGGDVHFDGKSILKQWDYRREIGYMPQIGRYPDNMLIGQVIDMVADLRNAPGQQRDDELIYALGVDKLMDKPMRTLSGGTRQKVSACLAFMFSPKVLIMDEPTAGLDPLSSEILKQKIATERNKGRLIIITSHILSDLDDLVSEVVYMQEGAVQFHNTIAELLAKTGERKLNKMMAVLMKNEP